MGIGTSDCPVFEGLYEYALLACGATLVGAKLILAGEADAAFNPSGGYHHAGPEKASGFCYINDVALACMVLAEAGKKVLYIDVDVHHGDGVAYAFYDRCDVMTISFHQDPRTLFPGTGFADEIGTGAGKGYCVNVPLPIGTYDRAYMEAFEAIAPPLISAYKPDVIVFELDAEVIRHLLSFDKPILMTGGGGYNVENTVRAWVLAWSVLCGADSNAGKNRTLGGVMLGSTDWRRGLRDSALVVSNHQHNTVMPAVEAAIKAVKAKVFAVHGL